MQEEFLSQQDLAIRWARHVQTLTKWRTLRRGPPFVKLGKIVRYAMSDILEFERNGLSKPVPRRQPLPDEQGPDCPVRLLTIQDVMAELQSTLSVHGGRRPSGT
jgi:hypothetical protein